MTLLEEVRIEAFNYLFEHAPEDSVKLMEKYINHSDAKIRNAALVSLAIEIKDNLFLRDKFNIENIIEEKLNGINNNKVK